MTDESPLDLLARSMESLRPATAPPAWAEIMGALSQPTGFRWHEGVETLIGFRAPPECEALAVVANGWGQGRPGLHPGGEVPIAAGQRRRIRVVCLVTRSGERAGYMRIGGDIVVHEPPGQGRVLDSLLRSFGLPTGAPAEPTDRVLAIMWLANVEDRAQASSRPLTWKRAAALHPAMQVLADLGKHIPMDQVTVALRAAGRAWTWDYLAEAVGSELLPAGAEEWMDEGMVSRWLSDALPDLDDILGRVDSLLPPPVTRKLHATLNQLDLLAAPHPVPPVDPNR